jgi:hypothetical protein
MKTRIHVIVGLLALAFLFSACEHAFRADKLPPISSWPLQSKGNNIGIKTATAGSGGSSVSTIGLMVTATDIDKKTNQVEAMPPLRPGFLEANTKRAYQDSGLFSEIKGGMAEADRRADVKITAYVEGNLALAFLTGLTLHIIPHTFTYDYVINTTFYDQAGKELGMIEKAESFTTWDQLFLVFLMSFKSPKSVHPEIIYDLNRAIIVEAHEKGII